jgi:hypothetical protein
MPTPSKHDSGVAEAVESHARRQQPKFSTPEEEIVYSCS